MLKTHLLPLLTARGPALRLLARLTLAMAGAGAAAMAAAAPLEGTLKKVAHSGVITLGTRVAAVPFSYLDSNHQQAGFGWDIAQKIVAQVRLATGRPDLKVRMLEVTAQTRLPLVANHTVDLECSSTSNTSERQKQVAFSVSYFASGARMLVRSDSPIKAWADLKGRTLVVGAGTTNERLMREMNDSQGLGATITLAPDVSEGFLMLESGRAAALVQDDVSLYSVGARVREPARWKVVGTPLAAEAYGCIFRRNDPAFKQLVDATLTGMMRSGELHRLYDTYFNAPLKLRGGVNLQMPMPALVQRLIEQPSDQAL